jgi:hypothetical protein
VVRLPSGAVSEELREMWVMMKEMMELQKASIKVAVANLEEVTWVVQEVLDSIQYGCDNEWEEEIFNEWVEDMEFGELENKMAELRAEKAEKRRGLEAVGEETTEEVGDIVVESGAGL